MLLADRSEVEATEAVRLLSIKEACRVLGVSRTTLYGEMASGRLRSVTLGRRRHLCVLLLTVSRDESHH